MGELSPKTKANFDTEIMPYISSCNIACGFHSGDAILIEKTIRSAIAHQVAIGAHPSYNDRENFGRLSQTIEIDKLMPQLRYQIAAVKGMTESLGAKFQHVKAHGALYNDMVKDEKLAMAFVDLVKSIDPKLRIVGLASSQIATICQSKNMDFVNEVFADRKYDNATTLRSRQHADAVLHEEDLVLNQVGRFLKSQIKDYEGEVHHIHPESICLHSDTKGALKLAQKIHSFLKSRDVNIASPQ